MKGAELSSQIQEVKLPVVERVVSNERLAQYAAVSGDQNPLHLDAGFAASTQFGGIIAHGMLTLAYVAEMLASAFGRSWLETGRLKVRLKGAAYPGDRLSTWGHVVKEEATGSHLATECAVGLINQRGEDIITGSAYLTRPVG